MLSDFHWQSRSFSGVSGAAPAVASEKPANPHAFTLPVLIIVGGLLVLALAAWFIGSLSGLGRRGIHRSRRGDSPPICDASRSRYQPYLGCGYQRRSQRCIRTRRMDQSARHHYLGMRHRHRSAYRCLSRWSGPQEVLEFLFALMMLHSAYFSLSRHSDEPVPTSDSGAHGSGEVAANAMERPRTMESFMFLGEQA
jgi:hypothetical protein